MRNILLLLVAILYTIVLATVSLLNSANLPSIQAKNGDKIAHIIAYFILCLLWYFALKTLKTSKPLLIASGVSVIYGIILEVLQGTLTEGRISDKYDILANCIGVVFVSIILVFRNKTSVKNL